MSNHAPTVEEVYCADIFADGTPLIDVCGPVARITWIAVRRDLGGDRRESRFVVARLVVPTALLPAIAAVMANPMASVDAMPPVRAAMN